MKKYVIVFIFLFSILHLLSSSVNGLSLQSPRFQLDVEEVGIDVKKDTSVYTLKSLYDSEALKTFQIKGFFVKSYHINEGLTFSLSPSLVNFTDLSSAKKQTEAVSLSLAAADDSNYNLSLIQEYPLKNFSADIMALEFSRDGINFKPLPDQNKGDSPLLINLSNKQDSKSQATIWFKPVPAAYQPEGTYETIIDFIAVPSY